MAVTGAYSFMELAAVNGQVNGSARNIPRDVTQKEKASKLTTMSNASIQSTPEDNRLRDELCQLILESFTPAHNQENCRIVLSQNHVQKIAELILANSTTEPCGVYGCCFQILLEGGEIPGQRKTLKIHRFGDAYDVAPTHEIYLILCDINGKNREGEPDAVKIFSKLKQFISSKIHSTRIVQNPQYRIEKKRLFRTAKPSSPTATTAPAASS